MQTATASVNMIGILVKKTLLDSAKKSSFLECVIESIIEREETSGVRFQYFALRFSFGSVV